MVVGGPDPVRNYRPASTLVLVAAQRLGATRRGSGQHDDRRPARDLLAGVGGAVGRRLQLAHRLLVQPERSLHLGSPVLTPRPGCRFRAKMTPWTASSPRRWTLPA